jgi:class 3 adenylate cyclase
MASTQPFGTVTFLFSDIEGSTKLWEQQPAAMGSALAQHDAILRSAVESNHGQIIKTTGDGVHAVFSNALDAANATLSAQQQFQTPFGELQLKIRMGIHSGEAEQRGGDYYGPALNRAARLMAASHGGQILITNATAELLRDQLPVGVSLRDLGEHRLKDLTRPEHIFQLSHPTLPD